MKTLTIDTSTEVLGVGLLKDGHIVGEVVTHIKKDHSSRLLPAIATLMKEVKIRPEDLSNIVIAKGPGSYTGVRIGVTTAKSLAWALEVPVISVSSLEVLAYNGRFFNGLICPFFDARRHNVYTNIYEWKNSVIHQVQEDSHVSMEKWLKKLSRLREEVLFLSPNIKQYEEMILEIMDDQAIIPEEPHHYIKPAFSYVVSRSKQEDNVHLLSPNYIRLAEAEINWLKRQEGER